ncbi:MAG: TetR/AcrR family transcriptional regulator [Janthinobacterium lividum]
MSVVDEPLSRRSRPAKAPLSRQWIIDATAAIMRREGLHKATMRRVAQELDTGPASLYVYFANVAALHAAVIDELVGQLEPSLPTGARAAAKALVTAYRDLLADQAGLARSALVVRPDGPNLLALYDRLVGLLLEAGATTGSAAWGADVLLQTATATAAEHARPEPTDIDAATDRTEQQSVLELAVRNADPARYQHLAALADAVLGGPPERRWEWVLDMQIAGLTAVPAPVRPTAEHQTNQESTP